MIIHRIDLTGRARHPPQVTSCCLKPDGHLAWRKSITYDDVTLNIDYSCCKFIQIYSRKSIHDISPDEWLRLYGGNLACFQTYRMYTNACVSFRKPVSERLIALMFTVKIIFTSENNIECKRSILIRSNEIARWHLFRCLHLFVFPSESDCRV